MNLPQATVNLRSDGVMASVVFGSPGDFQVATIMAYYDYDIQSWCDWDLSKENGKPVLVEKITDEFIQRVIEKLLIRIHTRCMMVSTLLR